jgi:hypothetical protein
MRQPPLVVHSQLVTIGPHVLGVGETSGQERQRPLLYLARGLRLLFFIGYSARSEI